LSSRPDWSAASLPNCLTFCAESSPFSVKPRNSFDKAEIVVFACDGSISITSRDFCSAIPDTPNKQAA